VFQVKKKNRPYFPYQPQRRRTSHPPLSALADHPASRSNGPRRGRSWPCRHPTLACKPPPHPSRNNQHGPAAQIAAAPSPRSPTRAPACGSAHAHMRRPVEMERLQPRPCDGSESDRRESATVSAAIPTCLHHKVIPPILIVTKTSCLHICCLWSPCRH
jgi:hypothetical protein